MFRQVAVQARAFSNSAPTMRNIRPTVTRNTERFMKKMGGDSSGAAHQKDTVSTAKAVGIMATAFGAGAVAATALDQVGVNIGPQYW